MTQSVTGTLTESARAAVRADHSERDREAWNLPRARADTLVRSAYRGGLDWNGFRDAYYPGSRRHNLEAIVAYGAYKRPLPVGEPPTTDVKGDAISIEAASLGQWEHEGGMLH